ncbi:hypothetical protein [Clostridium felsineum]|uniref:Uncharacterized protein n=1 Tax=Clostridium felsineum TaxID=36839 RepID=A0A1S8LJP9_9CLOT|nr:hypothetical protein [Clostridium felsineum]URZ09293.1 hypothetical protein CLROS_047090 [Clostridium felsineum]URZ13979.1 hypothetical protein CROST_047570 [Clostridium felsineum]
MKKIVISIFTVLFMLFSTVSVPALASSTTKDSNSDGIGRVNISGIPLPSDVKQLISGTYTYSGKVLISYKTANDVNTTDFYNLATMNDDGTGFKPIFSGVISAKAKANGIRFMPFQDNKRILLGDYVLECSPSIDNSTSTKLVPVVYPAAIENDSNVTKRWSEIIIAPDNNHMAWTTLRSDIGATSCVGTLKRGDDSYTVENPKVISTINNFQDDPKNPGCIIPNPMRAGEVKQFVHGGSAISAVGQKDLSTTDSIVQDLNSNNITQITYIPGYDETTIFSPDEHLGMVMSTRFSKNTDPAIFGIMPRPLGGKVLLDVQSLLYSYAVPGVRQSRQGNIGPVLVDINKSMNQAGYQGIDLNTDENWVYCSPMSWNSNGKSAMWIEEVRGNSSQRRLRRVDLLDYKPQKTVPIVATPDNIPGSEDLSALSSVNPNVQGKVVGKKSGYVNYTRKVSSSYSGQTEADYVNYSDDGINFYNGYEKISYNYAGESRYETNLKLTGKLQGEMNFRATFSALSGGGPKLLFDTDTDGNPKSYGYATYNGVTLNIKDLLP